MSTTTTTHFSLLALYLILSLNSLHMTMAARIIPQSAPSTVTRPQFLSEAETYLRPHLGNKQNVFQGRQVKNCLPKGYRHNSAPSRFVNYDTLGSSGCSGMRSEKPWGWCLAEWKGRLCKCWSLYMFFSGYEKDEIIVSFCFAYLWLIYLLQFWRKCLGKVKMLVFFSCCV